MAAMRDVACYFSIGLSPLPTPSAKLRTLSPAGERQFTPRGRPKLSTSVDERYRIGASITLRSAGPRHPTGPAPRPCSRSFTPGELPTIGDPTRAQ